MFKAKNRRVHTLSCIMGNAENPNVSIGIHIPLALPNIIKGPSCSKGG